MKGFLFKVKASSALVQRLDLANIFPFVTSAATFDHNKDTCYGVTILVSTCVATPDT